MILHTDTVIDPRTMMVPALNTLIADAAVVRSGCSQYLAPRTDIIRVEVFEQVADLVLFLEVARVLAACPKVAYRDEYEKDHMYH